MSASEYYQSLFNKFKKKYQQQLIEAVDDLFEKKSKFIIDLVLNLFETVMGKSAAERAIRCNRRSQKRKAYCYQYELAFAEYILNQLQKIGEKQLLYWDLDETLMYLTGTFRPVATLLLKFLKEHGYVNGIFSNKGSKAWILQALDNPFQLGPIAEYVSLDYVESSKTSVIVVYGGMHEPLTDRPEEKISKFLNNCKDGILIDDEPATKMLEPMHRGICVNHLKVTLY